jgi:pSer/pThr/pTyr-binding forkhead associated (FHA) protein
LRQSGGDLLAEDLNSANGTTINGERLGNNPGGMLLKPGDRIRVGGVDFVYEQA